LNFANKLFPKIVTNTTYDAIYDIDMVIPNETNLQSYIGTFANSKSFINSMHQFSENLVLSTVTRETIYSVLSNFV
jgi:hypothetical protein